MNFGHGMMVIVSGLPKRGRIFFSEWKRSAGVFAMGTTRIIGPSMSLVRMSMSSVLRSMGKYIATTSATSRLRFTSETSMR